MFARSEEEEKSNGEKEHEGGWGEVWLACGQNVSPFKSLSRVSLTFSFQLRPTSSDSIGRPSFAHSTPPSFGQSSSPRTRSTILLLARTERCSGGAAMKEGWVSVSRALLSQSVAILED